MAEDCFSAAPPAVSQRELPWKTTATGLSKYSLLPHPPPPLRDDPEKGSQGALPGGRRHSPRSLGGQVGGQRLNSLSVVVCEPLCPWGMGRLQHCSLAS